MWFSKVFDNFEEAATFQREKLQYCLDQGWSIRQCDIVDELDFDTKERRYCAFVRPYVITTVVVPW